MALVLLPGGVECGAGDDLSDVEKSYRALFEDSRDAVYVTQRDGSLVAVNPAGLEMFGFTREEMIGADAQALYADPECRGQFQRAVEKEGSVRDYEVRLRKKDGTGMDCLLTATVRRSSAGEVAGYQGIIRDVTEARRRERALILSEERYALAIRGANDGIWDWNLDIDEIHFSSRWSSMLGLGDDETGSRPGDWFDRVHPDDIRRMRAEIDAHRAGLIPFFEYEHRLRHKDGTWRWVIARGIGVRDASGRVHRMAGSLSDVTARKKTEEALRESERRLQELIGSARLAAVVLDAAGSITDLNAALEEVTGWTKENLVGHSWFDQLVPPDRRIAERDGFDRLLASRAAASHDEGEVFTRSGERRSIDWSRSVLRDAEGKPGGMICLGVDLTASRRAEEAARTSDRRYHALFEDSREAITITTRDGNFVDVNRAACALFGYGREEMIGLAASTLYVQAPNRERFQKEIEEKGFVEDYEVRLRKRDGAEMDCLLSSVVWRSADGIVLGYQSIIRDVTETRAEIERRLAESFRDPLTGLPNRELFLDRVRRAIDRGKRRCDVVFALLLVEIRTKAAQLAAGAGDALLVEAARRLEAALRPGDTVGRLRGNEFVILLAEVKDVSHVGLVVDRIRRVLTVPFRLRNVDVDVDEAVEIGVALSGAGFDRPEDYLTEAERARTRGRELRDEELSAPASRVEVAPPQTAGSAVDQSDLEGALSRGELKLHYQPIVTIVTNRIVGFEALVRWQHPERGLLAAGEFFPRAAADPRTLRALAALDSWVIPQACRQARVWVDRFGPGFEFFISVNVSGSWLVQSGAFDEIGRSLSAANLDPRFLRLEVPAEFLSDRELQGESGAREAGLRSLFRIPSDLGVRLTADGVRADGNGLDAIRRAPFASWKIDKGVVRGIDSDPSSAALIKDLVTGSKGAGVDLIATGVETTEELDRLRETGCGYFQGNYFSEPVDPEIAEVVVVMDVEW